MSSCALTFDRYFSNFHDRLVLHHGRTDIDQPLRDYSELMRLSDFTRNQISCQA